MRVDRRGNASSSGVAYDALIDAVYDLALSSDGLQLYSDFHTAVGDFYFQGNIGLPRTDDSSTERALLGNDFPGDLDGDQLPTGLA